MKNYVKKLISSLMAISLVAPVFSGIPVFAENSDGTIVDQTQALTVVGKRIKGDDTYFEISLEVNEDHDNFSSVGVVLRYDPDYIIPAESWDEGAGAADMSENTTWATRRALPTLGLETWSTHTALAYQEDTPAPGAAGGKKYGYLYLGAEHPLAVEEPEATADPSATAAPTADPSAPTAEPEATPAPGTRPVVVARFMYKTTAGDATAVPPVVEVTGANMKAKLTEDWTTGTNSSGSAEPINWDYDWTSNKILTIADDDVAGKSPAQYPFAIYTQDYVEKAYMHTWPTVTPTATTAPGDPTPTPMPVSAYAPVIGTGVDAANHLTKDDIMIITCEGESAKATGGLKLSDVFSILFFDWDNSFLGALTAGIGVDVTADVDRYVESQFIHPDLRGEEYDALNTAGTITQRQYNYRGEYPYTGPAASNPTIPDSVSDYTDKLTSGDKNPNAGSLFPLTNKLDYCFAGKDIDTDHPFANGWTAVVTSEPDYSDTTKFPGYIAKTLPTYMETTFTSLDSTQTFGRMPELDTAGQVVDTTLTASDIPDVVSFDFETVATMTQSDLDTYYGGNIYLKAVYTPGEMLNRITTANSSLEANYVALGPITPGTVGTSTATVTTFSFAFEYRRLNLYGYGVNRIKEPSIKMDLQQVGASASTPLQVLLTNKDVLDVFLTPTNSVATVGYQLADTYGANVIEGAKRTLLSELGVINISGPEGAGFKIKAKTILTDAYNNTSGTWITQATLKDLQLSKDTSGGSYNAKTAKNAQTPLVNLVSQAVAAGENYEDISWYQIQYALINTSSPYVDKATAKSWCEGYQALKDKAALV